MEIRLTEDVSHKKNGEYTGVLVQFDPVKDTNYWENKHNWVPKSNEAYALFCVMYATDKKFRGLIKYWCKEEKEGPSFPMENMEGV